MLHEDATQSLAAQALPDDGDVLVVVGPEGGITPEEVAAFEAAGAADRAARRHGAALVQRRTGRARGAERGRPLALSGYLTEKDTVFSAATLSPSLQLSSRTRMV